MYGSNYLSSKTSYAPFTFTSGYMKTTPVHQTMETPTEIEMQEHVYQKPARCVHKLKRHLVEIWTFAMMCLWYVTVMTFKAYTTAVMSEQIDWRFYSQGRMRTAARRGGKFCCKCTTLSVCQKYKNIVRFDKVIAKTIRVQFFAPQCI